MQQHTGISDGLRCCFHHVLNSVFVQPHQKMCKMNSKWSFCQYKVGENKHEFLLWPVFDPTQKHGKFMMKLWWGCVIILQTHSFNTASDAYYSYAALIRFKCFVSHTCRRERWQWAFSLARRMKATASPARFQNCTQKQHRAKSLHQSNPSFWMPVSIKHIQDNSKSAP